MRETLEASIASDSVLITSHHRRRMEATLKGGTTLFSTDGV